MTDNNDIISFLEISETFDDKDSWSKIKAYNPWLDEYNEYKKTYSKKIRDSNLERLNSSPFSADLPYSKEKFIDFFSVKLSELPLSIPPVDANFQVIGIGFDDQSENISNKIIIALNSDRNIVLVRCTEYIFEFVEQHTPSHFIKESIGENKYLFFNGNIMLSVKVVKSKRCKNAFAFIVTEIYKHNQRFICDYYQFTHEKCERMIDLNEDSTYIVEGIIRIDSKYRTFYIIIINNKSYRSDYFIEKILESIDSTTNESIYVNLRKNKITFELGTFKTCYVTEHKKYVMEVAF